MTARERQGTGSASAVLTPAKTDAALEQASAFSWNDWFRHATPQQRATALHLASQQGVLYPTHLPATSNGKCHGPPTKDTAASTLLARVLSGKADAAAPLASAEVTFHDLDLDELQQQAVRRALATPDILLLQGPPGVGKSRVLAEIILQAAGQGQRVLFLAAHSASLDVVLERLLGRSDVLPLRFLDAAEKLEALPAWLRGMTIEEQKRSFQERMIGAARSNRDRAEIACRQRRDEEPLWAELNVCVAALRTKGARREELGYELARLKEVVEQTCAVSDGQKSCDDAIAAIDRTLQERRDECSMIENKAAERTAQIERLQPAYQAKKLKRFWTLAFWFGSGQAIADMDALLAERSKLYANRDELTATIAALDDERKQRLRKWQTERDAIVAREIEQRKRALDDELRVLEAEAEQLHEQCQTSSARLGLAGPPDAGVAKLHEAWKERKKLDEDQCQFAHQWATYLDGAGAEIAARLPSYANVLAGTIERFHADAKFREALAAPPDLVILEDAETLTDADVLKLSRLGERCLLVGTMLTSNSPALEKTRAPLAAAWPRLWHALDGHAWPHHWTREAGRLVCQLLALSADDRKHLEAEVLCNAPDIELRILHRPATCPCLAEVTFGPQCSFAEAFRFMLREVQELALEPVGRTHWWRETCEKMTRCLGVAGHVNEWIELEPGVRLGAIQSDEVPRIAAIDFDKAAGWNRATAQAWLQKHRPTSDSERTVFLQTPYRYQHLLGNIVRTMIGGQHTPTTNGHVSQDVRSFEFIASPPLQKAEWPREGAGLELDLTSSRPADRMPNELRRGLPARGFANYLEGQALIRRLEAFAQKDVNGQPCRVAVLALFEAQVELLRRLVGQSEVLRSFPVEIALASRLHQRECDVVFLSLTRSHGHRAVAFSENARDLAVALTRARSRLFLFGDPGTLLKRIHWQGPLDRLDAHAAHEEQRQLAQLVAVLQTETASNHANGHANGKK